MRIQGAVIRRDQDPRKELPIADAIVTASNGKINANTQSDSTGYFKLTFPAVVWPGERLTLHVRHNGYVPLNLSIQAGLRFSSKSLYIAALEPAPQKSSSETEHPAQVVSNIRIRYTFNGESQVSIGSAVRTFQAVSSPNVPCNHQSLCSPDGAFKASSGTVTLEAGPGNEFRNVRASCIAGPCPFTRINDSGFVNGGEKITASAISWAGTATFLLEAEVYRVANTSSVRETYPVIFGPVLNFTVPPTHEGVSIEAEINGVSMVFPLGPELYLSWANCTTHTSRQSGEPTVYRCELKPGYKF
ncbi:MAG TPA: carboxypeptidase-like regulatory domain-containing protein [Terracidiphilus sp.]|nr:carboxypeptidase-like regulatory domain-containing protein [Terracidiphilus sp.]